MGIEPFAIKAGSPTKPVPGYNIQILDSDGNQLPNGEEGAVVIKLPLPPGCLPTLWQDDKRYLEYVTERPGYYVTGDGGRFDENGYIYIMGRIDDVINVAGHRLSTGAMEEIVSKHKDVAECAVFGAEGQLSLYRLLFRLSRPAGAFALSRRLDRLVGPGRYYDSLRALAAGNLDPAQHWYPLGYAILAVPFVFLGDHPFFVIDLVSLLVAYRAFIAFAIGFDIPPVGAA